MNPNVDQYLIDGCGRCPLYQTPKCKVHTWTAELKLLRGILLECGLEEEYKWKQPCYTVNGGNVLILSAFKEYSSLNFFKGALLNDPDKMLVKAGANSHHARQLRFTSTEQIEQNEDHIRSYVLEATENEIAGRKVESNTAIHPIPDELSQMFEDDPAFMAAFEALTPGRQRGYLIYFSQAKQPKTRISRIEKYIDTIFEGKGMHDNYK